MVGMPIEEFEKSIIEINKHVSEKHGKITFSNKKIKCCSLKFNHIDHIFRNKERVVYILRKNIIFYDKDDGRGIRITPELKYEPCQINLNNIKIIEKKKEQ